MLSEPSGNTETVRSLCMQLATCLQRKHWMLTTAESCTGGLIAAACTDLPGSSTWFDRGFVTYSNAAKTDMLGVDAALITHYGAVSKQVAQAMAEGARTRANAQVALAVTGIAGPAGGSTDKPVGTIWLAWALPTGTVSERQCFTGNRAAIRQATVLHSLHRLVQLVKR